MAPDLPRAALLAANAHNQIALTPNNHVTPLKTNSSAGILTVCPSTTPFGLTLGPTNPGMIDIAQETLDFRCRGFSPQLRLLVPAFSLPYTPGWLTPFPSTRMERFPTASATRWNFQ